ncbi:hypothetical protein [Piscinibacter koreensis]|uniref:Uncharacterized protein n=1 Tax=Piscinibacter koreensis TaxID=2742824 RepID=A0A7Y6NL31_9BURK|nr:hypothetical protein [Schlegelella koreensis]NUZ05188.1 hypothetical protein [Schlegelella koreensis]
MNGFSTLPRPVHLAMGSLARRAPRAHFDWPLVGFWASYLAVLGLGINGLANLL